MKQQLLNDISVEFCFFYTLSDDGTLQAIYRNFPDVGLIIDREDGREAKEIEQHLWAPHAYRYMAGARNKLMAFAVEDGFDYFFSVDSDIVARDRLSILRLIAHLEENGGGIAAPRVNLGQGNETAWNWMSWTSKDGHWTADRCKPKYGDAPPPEGDADVVMAALLFDRRGLEAVWHDHWQGEDIGLCRDAEEKGIPRFWLPSIPFLHFMQKDNQLPVDPSAAVLSAIEGV